MSTKSNDGTASANDSSLARLVGRMRQYVRDMDARISIARCEIREKEAAAGQLEKEKWNLESEIDKIEKEVSANTKLTHD